MAGLNQGTNHFAKFVSDYDNDVRFSHRIKRRIRNVCIPVAPPMSSVVGSLVVGKQVRLHADQSHLEGTAVRELRHFRPAHWNKRNGFTYFIIAL